MTELPEGLQGYVSGVGRVCHRCGARVVEAVVGDEPYLCPRCAPEEDPGEDALTQAALMDPEADAPPADRGPTGWRLVALIALAVAALAFVFWK